MTTPVSTWNAFDPEAYSAHNYATLRADDKYVMTRAAEFFGSAGMAGGAHAVDVGPGANLYPRADPASVQPQHHRCGSTRLQQCRLAAQPGRGVRPHVGRLLGHARRASDAQRRRRPARRARRTRRGGPGQPVRPAARALGPRHHVLRRGIHDHAERRIRKGRTQLRRRAAPRRALRRGVRGELRSCYSVAARPFPAVRVGSGEVRSALAGCAEDVAVERIGLLDVRWRDGYTGMVFATGRASRVPAPTGVPCRETGSESSGT
ncbi:hypothetical protein ACU686_41655 [Yinghuangia aomiensis]